VSQNGGMADEEVSGALPDAPPVRATDETAELPVVVVPAVEPDAEPVVVEPEPVADEIPAAVPVVASHAAPRRGRRWPWVALGILLGLVVAVAAGGLWYVSGLIGAGARVPQPDAGFAMTIDAVDGDRVEYSGVEPGWGDQGLMGIASVEGGYLQTDDPRVSGDAGSRAVTGQVLPPSLAAGQAAALDGWYFPRNPLVGLGLPYEDVEFDTPLGAAPAWLIPGTSSTWVVYTHGRGAGPGEGLRIASTVAELGYPMLLIRYRNDALAPPGNGYAQFGVDEWQDLEGAVQYALDNGAERVVLAGTSMGGSVSLAFLQNSPLADRVVGTFLDSPLADFSQVVEIRAADQGIPGFVTALGMQVAQWRYGFDFDAADYTADAAEFRTPMLIVQGTADTTVPPEVATDFAAAAPPGLVTLELVEGAGHLLSWNVDRSRYEALLSGFLAEVAPRP
jgi:uncharacterized protein